MNATVHYNQDEALRRQTLLERWKAFYAGEVKNLQGRVPEEAKKESEAREKIFEQTIK